MVDLSLVLTSPVPYHCLRLIFQKMEKDGVLLDSLFNFVYITFLLYLSKCQKFTVYLP